MKYYIFTSKARMDKAINSLLGILEGIAIDSVLNQKETQYLVNWLTEHEEYAVKHPFNELLPVIANALNDNVLSSEEHQEIVWLCEKFRSTEYYSDIVADIQRLQSILAGISSDGVITEEELDGLSEWLEEHEHLKTCYPYDEVDSLIISALADRKIDQQEHAGLIQFFDEFSSIKSNDSLKEKNGYTLTGICAADPIIKFEDSIFCFTGESKSMSRKEFSVVVETRGGLVVNSISRKLNYLVVGAAGNPCWKYACYGMKIEKAVKLRKEGIPIVIVHENDLLDAVA